MSRETVSVELDQLVVGHVRRHTNERRVASPLPHELVAGGVRDQVRGLERGDVAVVDELADRVAERGDHRRASERIRVAPALNGDPASSVNSSITAWPPKRPQPAVLDAAERHLRLVADWLVVHVDDPGLELLREREAAVGVSRDDPRRRGRSSSRSRARSQRRRCRRPRPRAPARTSLVGELGVLRDVGEYRRLVARADDLAAREHAGALRDRVVDAALHQSRARFR